jgi:NADPH:quinone reductase-like Zn-dependent oxidoreductase
MLLTSYGDNPSQVMTLATRPNPQTPAAHEVIIHVDHIGINPLDCEVRRGYGAPLLGQFAPLPCIRGQEAVGTIVAMGAHVWDYKLGDRVWVSLSPLTSGAYATYITARPEEVSLAPTVITPREAASLPFAATTLWAAFNSDGPGQLLKHCDDTSTTIPSVAADTAAPTLSRASPLPTPMTYLRKLSSLAVCASQMIPQSPHQQSPSSSSSSTSSSTGSSTPISTSRARLIASPITAASLVNRLPSITRITASQTGARIFINGGSGSLGTLAIQWLHYYGYHITATCSSAHVDRLRALGCDHVIDYTKEDYHTMFAGRGAFDYFLDCQGGVNYDARGEQRYHDDELKAIGVLRRGGHLATFRGALLRSLATAPNLLQGFATRYRTPTHIANIYIHCLLMTCVILLRYLSIAPQHY